jgi:hypothetical protein
VTFGRVSIRLRWPGGHWPILVLSVVASLAAVSAFWLALRTVNDAEDRIERSRLGLAELAAALADHILTEAFFELEVVAESVSLNRKGQRAAVANFNAPLFLLDTDGQATAIGESGALRSGVDPRVVEIATRFAGATDRLVSGSFTLPATGLPTVALAIPIFDDHGGHTKTIVGFMDVDEHLRNDLAEVTAQFGVSAHADIVDAQGLVLASAEREADGTPGHHPDFYRRAASQRLPTVELVSHTDGSPPHVVAYAPMGGAPWGVALGASEEETFRAPDARRRELISAAIASAVTLSLGMLLVAVEVRGRNAAS